MKEYKHGKRGFASMDPSLQRSIASLGGIRRARKGVGHFWTPEEARAAGAKGVAARAAKRLSRAA